MAQTKDLTEIKALLAVALDARTRLAPTPTESSQDVDTIRAGVLKSADNIPVKAMSPASQAGRHMDYANTEGLQRGRQDKSRRRTAKARQRAKRIDQIMAIERSPVVPTPERMAEAWAVVLPLYPIITGVAQSKGRWAARFLGSVEGDLGGMSLEAIALVLAKSDHDLTALQRAADELGGMIERTGRIPGRQESKGEKGERKAVAKDRSWLMGLVNNRVMGAVVDIYTTQRNLRWENLDTLTTVIATISGVGDDPHTARFKADRAPAFFAGRFPAPGGIDPDVLATVIGAAITERGCDPLVDLLLDNLRTDGAVRWADVAEQVFLTHPDGGWQWDLVVRATEHHLTPSRSRADAARQHVRNRFEFLPGVIVGAVDAMDVTRVASEYDHGNGWRRVMASQFELFYLGDPSERTVLAPSLRFASPAEAAEALVEYLSVLTTGSDMIAELVSA